MTGAPPDDPNRRPLASRDAKASQAVAVYLTRLGVSPNVISITSIVFAIAAGSALACTAYCTRIDVRVWWIAAALLVQLRLLANMFDGMVAIASGKKSPLGELYNEVPDRISDPVILIGAGYAVGSEPTLGYIAALLAMFVAYVRAVGASTEAGQAFIGPMAKPQRMFVITVACVYCGLAPQSWQSINATTELGVMGLAICLIIGGCLITVVRRLRHICSILHGRT